MPTEAMDRECTLIVPGDFAQGQDKAFYASLKEEIRSNPRQVHLDCSELHLVQSSHIGLLWVARDICSRTSTKVVLRNANGTLLDSLRVLDLAEFFGIDELPVRLPVKSASAVKSSSNEANYTSSFPASIADINAGLDGFVGFLKTLNIGDELSFNMRTVFYEVATNIRCHSGLKENDLIEFRASYENGMLTQFFQDNGMPFDPTTIETDFDPQTAAHSRRTRGFGISLIKGLVSDVTYKRTDKGNLLSLTTQCREMP